MLGRVVVLAWAAFVVTGSVALAQPVPEEMDGVPIGSALRRIDSRFVTGASGQRFEVVTWSDAQGRHRVTVEPAGHAPSAGIPEEMDRVTGVPGVSDGLASSTSASARWTALGPDGGQITAINVSPTNSQLLLAGAGISQGYGPLHSIYRSIDGGANWSPALTLQSQFGHDRAVRQITFAPDGVAYAAAGMGLLRSSDGGVTWDVVRAGQAMAVAVDPSDPHHLWAGFSQYSNPRVQRSSDGGATWTPVDVPAVAQTACLSIVFDPARPGVVVLAFGEYAKGQVWFSSDDGAHWTNRSISATCPVVNKLVRSGQHLYAAVGEWVGAAYIGGGLYVSTDDGANWQNRSAWNPAYTTVAEDVAADPSNPCILWVANQGGILRSPDCGQTWVIRVALGSTAHAIVALPGVAFAGSETDGVLKSINGAPFQPTSRGIRELSIEDVATNPLHPNEVAAAASQLNSGGVYTSTDGGQTWKLEPTVRQRITTVQFAPDGLLHAITDGPGIPALHKRNATGTWGNLGPFRGATPVALCFDPAQPGLILLAGRDDTSPTSSEGVIWRSTNGGIDWRRTFAGPSLYFTDMTVVGSGGSQAMLASAYSYANGTPPGKVLRSIDRGYTWTDLGTAGIPNLFYPFSFAVSRQNPDRVYMTNAFGPPGVFRSEDGGRTWNTTGYTIGGVGHLVVHPDDDQVLYTGGLPARRSRDGGRTFQTLGEGDAPVLAGYRVLVLEGDCPRLMLASSGGVQVLDDGDVERPRLTVRADHDELWPPNHELTEIHTTVAAHDDCDEHPQWRLASITADDGRPVDAGDIEGASIGTPDATFRLRASRAGSGPGRAYAVTYEATDAAGNSERRTITITAPHDQSGRVKRDAVAERNGAIEVVQPPGVIGQPSGAEIRFGVLRPQQVRVDVFDPMGARVRTLTNGMWPAGAHAVTWDGHDGSGRAAPSGVYLVRITSADLHWSGKAVLVR